MNEKPVGQRSVPAAALWLGYAGLLPQGNALPIHDSDPPFNPRAIALTYRNSPA